MTKKDDKGSTPINTGHPLLRNAHALSTFMERLNGTAEEKEALIEHLEDWKRCVNRLATIPDGIYFLKMMIKHSQIFSPKKGQGAERLLKLEGMQAFYLEYVRPYLDPALRKELE